MSDHSSNLDPRWTAAVDLVTNPVLAEVVGERARQDVKWGEQNHPDGTGPDVVWAFTGPARWVVKCALDATDAANDAGAVSWRDILVEEVAEAIAEDDPAKLRNELIQVAAVCVQWVEALDRRGGTEAASERALAQLRENLSDDSRLAQDIRAGRLPLSQPGDPMSTEPGMSQP